MGIVRRIPFFDWFFLTNDQVSSMWWELAESSRGHSGRVEIRRESLWEFISRKLS